MWIKRAISFLIHTSIIELLISIYFNFRYLTFRNAILLPIWLTKYPKIYCLKKGQIVLRNPNRRSVLLGGYGSIGLPSSRIIISVKKGAVVIFEGSAIIGEGTGLRCDEDSEIQFGDRFFCNKNCFFRSTSKICFGEDCSVGWNVQVNTTNGHPVFRYGVQKAMNKDCLIKDNVWIASNVCINKGVSIQSGSIVSQGSVLVGTYDVANALIGGNPARIIATGYSWEK